MLKHALLNTGTDSTIYQKLKDLTHISNNTENQQSQPLHQKMEPNIQFKIGMIAPKGSGKTALISAICSEVQERLASEPLEFWPVGSSTQQAMQRANAAFNTAINSPNNLFEVPKLQPTSDVQEYLFAVTLTETGQTIGFSVLDYPGEMLGNSDFGSQVTPFLLESSALFVPISSDILMYWSDTKSLTDTINKKCNATADMTLDCDNVILAIKNWIAHKKRLGIPAQLFFVPIKCEKYFNDNGGSEDSHLKLQNAIFERYVEPLEMTAEEKLLIQTNIYYVDTYGVVALNNVEVVKAKDKDASEKVTLVPKFRRRNDQGKKRRTKNAYELLMGILKFQVENRFKAQQRETAYLSNEKDVMIQKANVIRNRYRIAQNKAKERKDSYSIFGYLLYTLIPDKELSRLEEEARRTYAQARSSDKSAAFVFDQYQLSAQQCESLKKAFDTLTELNRSMPNRQCVVQ